jgi:acyl-CoA:acyl-CoA alkyltransferase
VIIKGIAASLPERRVTNEQLIDLVRQHSTGHFSGDLEHTLKLLLHILKRSGLVERRWCDRYESPIDHVAIAVREAMRRCYLRRQHIELLIYVGVGRGFIEPGNSHMMANALGFHKAHCFDVVDACMSWLRALDMVDSLFKTGKYKNALVINAEFFPYFGGRDIASPLVLHSADQIAYSFPTFTIGDAATATILYPQDPDNFDFNYSSRPDLSALCTIPLEGFENFCHPVPEIGKNGILGFTAFGEELHHNVEIEVTQLFNGIKHSRDVDTLFVHSSSYREWDKYARSVGMGDKTFQTYPETGNLVSAAIPTAISQAVAQGKLNRGDRVGVWLGSAGMSFAFSRFKF